MPITWVPTPGSGYFKNFKMVGNGQVIDETKCIIKNGDFNNNGLLESVNGIILDYSDSSNVILRKGEYTNGQEDGLINEYVFSKNNWTDFQTESGTTSTRYRKSFTAGVLDSTLNTYTDIPIKGVTTRRNNQMNNIIGLAFDDMS